MLTHSFTHLPTSLSPSLPLSPSPLRFVSDDYLSYCSSDFDDGGYEQGMCSDSCYCKLGDYYTRTDEQSCDDLIRDSEGVAPDARVAFFDLGASDGTLVAPANLKNKFFPAAFDAGARIHSNSWGSTLFSYETDDLNVDTFAYNNPSMLILFAAGNDGDSGHETVFSPAQVTTVR